MNNIPSQVGAFLRDLNIDIIRDRVLVAVSGGADSVCLLRALTEVRRELASDRGLSPDQIPETIIAAHVHHGIRLAADEDAAFVRRLCQSIDIPFFLEWVDVPAVAERDHIGLEEAGRNERYRILKALSEEHGAKYVALGHHRDDVAETFLMNLFRGTGLHGLTGIRPVRERFIRPLIRIPRQAIEDYLEATHSAYVSDETNFGNEFTRNRLRNVILEHAEEEINPRTRQHIAEAATRLAGAEDYITMEAEKALASCRRENGIDTKRLSELHPFLRAEALRLALIEETGSTEGITAAHIESLLKLASDPHGMQAIRLMNGRKASVVYGLLTFADTRMTEAYGRPFALTEQLYMQPAALPVPDPGKTSELLLPDGDLVRVTLTKDIQINTNASYTKCFDYDTIDKMPVIRTRKSGDRICADKEGNLVKRVKKDMIDLKVPADIRDRILLLASGDEVMWIPGLRYNFAYRITERTTRALVVEWIPA